MARRPITIALIDLGNPKFNLERSCGAEVNRNEILKGKVSVPESARALLRETDESVKAPRANSEICLRARDLLGSPEPCADSHERQEPKRLCCACGPRSCPEGRRRVTPRLANGSSWPDASSGRRNGRARPVRMRSHTSGSNKNVRSKLHRTESITWLPTCSLGRE